MSPSLRHVAGAVSAPCVAVGCASGAHLLLLLGAALTARRHQAPPPADRLRLAVVIPAHDEEHQVAAAIRSIQASGYPADRRRVIVVADNCSDRTAAVARAAGADVLERHDTRSRGKGPALAWAFERVLAEPWSDAVCVIDADCEVSPNLLGALAARLADGAQAAQASYLVSGAEASTGAALRWAAFALFNLVRPMGRAQLGLSAGLLGTGMCFSRRLLADAPWEAFSLAEDREQHMRWALKGIQVAFAPEAQVRSPAAATRAAVHTQAARWDSGRSHLARALSPRLLTRWARRGDVAALDAALEPVLPPQAALLAINLAAAGTSAPAGVPALRRLAAAAVAAQIGYVLIGLWAVGAPASVWRALGAVPAFVARRLRGLAGAAIGSGPSDWVRTARPLHPATAPTEA